MVGGFDNEGKTGCDTDAGPEKTLDLEASLQAKGHPARWRTATARSLDGGIDLGAMLRPGRGVVAYVLALLDEPAARRTVLALGTSGGFRLWVNGEKVATGDAYHPARPDQERVSVQLRAGVNRVLLKVCHEDSGVLGAYLRDESARARPVTPARLPPLPAGQDPAAKRLPTLATALEAEVTRRPDDARLRGGSGPGARGDPGLRFAGAQRRGERRACRRRRRAPGASGCAPRAARRPAPAGRESPATASRHGARLCSGSARGTRAARTGGALAGPPGTRAHPPPARGAALEGVRPCAGAPGARRG